MKIYRSSIPVLMLVVTLGVAQADTGKKAPQPPAVNKVTPQKPTQPSTQQPKTHEKEPWPRTFVPSEKITADSVVSFPVDI